MEHGNRSIGPSSSHWLAWTHLHWSHCILLSFPQLATHQGQFSVVINLLTSTTLWSQFLFLHFLRKQQVSLLVKCKANNASVVLITVSAQYLGLLNVDWCPAHGYMYIHHTNKVCSVLLTVFDNILQFSPYSIITFYFVKYRAIFFPVFILLMYQNCSFGGIKSINL